MTAYQDLRGFRYALEPARRSAHHRFDVALSELGQAQRELSRLEAAFAACQVHFEQVAVQHAPRLNGAIDPAQALANLHHLERLRKQLLLSQQSLERQRVVVDDAVSKVKASRIDREALDAHRDMAQREHGINVARQQQVAEDQDWLARAEWRAAGQASSVSANREAL